jgi:hypothetical protein
VAACRRFTQKGRGDKPRLRIPLRASVARMERSVIRGSR